MLDSKTPQACFARKYFRFTFGRADDAAFDGMLERIPDLRLFTRFVEIDGSTEGKKPEPVEWLKEELRRRGRVTE